MNARARCTHTSRVYTHSYIIFLCARARARCRASCAACTVIRCISPQTRARTNPRPCSYPPAQSTPRYAPARAAERRARRGRVAEGGVRRDAARRVSDVSVAAGGVRAVRVAVDAVGARVGSGGATILREWKRIGVLSFDRVCTNNRTANAYFFRVSVTVVSLVVVCSRLSHARLASRALLHALVCPSNACLHPTLLLVDPLHFAAFPRIAPPRSPLHPPTHRRPRTPAHLLHRLPPRPRRPRAHHRK